VSDKYAHVAGCKCASCAKIRGFRKETGNASWDHRQGCGCGKNRDDAQERIDELAKRFHWSRERRQDFHRYLEKNYKQEKDDLSFQQLLAIAEEFEA
jgi:hypothetical protein